MNQNYTVILLQPNIFKNISLNFLQLNYFCTYVPIMPAGRKPIYDVKSLKIGEKLRLPDNLREYRHQYLRNFNGDEGPKKFKLVESRKKLFVERIA